MMGAKTMTEWKSKILSWLQENHPEFEAVRAAFRCITVADQKLEVVPHSEPKPALHYLEIYRFRREEMGLTDTDCPGLSPTIEWLNRTGGNPVHALSVSMESKSALLFSDEQQRVRVGILLKSG